MAAGGGGGGKKKLSFGFPCKKGGGGEERGRRRTRRQRNQTWAKGTKNAERWSLKKIDNRPYVEVAVVKKNILLVACGCDLLPRLVGTGSNFGSSGRRQQRQRQREEEEEEGEGGGMGKMVASSYVFPGLVGWLASFDRKAFLSLSLSGGA